MIDPHFVILGAVVGFLGGLSYLVDTLKGTVQPNRVSWFMWSLAPLVAFAAEVKQGVGLQSLMTFMVGLCAPRLARPVGTARLDLDGAPMRPGYA